jgi:pimeloyl-ACP methyl ester carboxylesterase
MGMRPFEISFSAEMISDLRLRIARTRWPELPFHVGWARGTDDATLRGLASYWLEGYDVAAIQERLNRLHHLRGPIDGEDLHCVVYQGRGDRRLPLLLLHGWPGSFVEFLSAAELLRSPADGIGFDLVVPSLPGFAFSAPSREPGMDGGRIARRLHRLMQELGYERYGVQGGDWGAFIGTALALQQPTAVIGLHLNLIPIPERLIAPEGETPSAAERDYLRFWDSWSHQNSGYDHLQSTRPHTLSYAQHDSPVGLLAWLLEKLWAWSDHGEDLWETLDRDQVLTNVMLYWLPGRALTAASIYYGMEHSGYGFLAGRVEVPTGYARFPKEPWSPPPDMVQRKWNLVHYTEQPRGGHFAAMEQPALFASDVSAFFSSL